MSPVPRINISMADSHGPRMTCQPQGPGLHGGHMALPSQMAQYYRAERSRDYYGMLGRSKQE
eukprot:4635743-Pyramimonas_sp.AAC.1